MAETKLKAITKDEFQQIMEHIANGDNFLLSGGAGSGKTYSLVAVIRKVIEDNPTTPVACMTYTNAAVKQIEERVHHSNLTVTTIHDFLWDNIKHFQKELKHSLVDLINNPDETRIQIDTGTVADNYFDDLEDEIQYKEFLRISEGIISHDEVIVLANKMFSDYPRLCNILKDKFKFIFIDEYQDTQKDVVDIFLVHLQKSNRKNIIGFFGDAMQAIYPAGIGNLDDYKGNAIGHVKEVKKEQNRRNPKLVYELANKLRVDVDGLVQTHSDDSAAPNMVEGVVKQGTIKFIYSVNANLQKVRDELKWDFTNSKQTKELNLTHNLIAGKAGFGSLMEIYDRDGIVELKSRVNREIKDRNLDILEGLTFGDVIDNVNLTISPTTVLGRFLSANPELYQIARNYPFAIFKKIYLNKDQLLDDKKKDIDDESKKGSNRDNLIKHLFKIQTNIHLYQKKHFNEFLRATDFRFKLRSVADKRALKNAIDALVNVGEETIEEIIIKANDSGICLIEDKLKRFQDEREYVYNRVKGIRYKEFQNLYNYLEGMTPFSTQHKTKGDEFDNVLVILDNGRWNDYNFGYLFLNNGTESVLKRTQKIFYVCCTRARENLAVYYHNPAPNVIDKAKEWFGEANVIPLE